jgi:RimJ/RimL family protein N-acetyltransferase
MTRGARDTPPRWATAAVDYARRLGLPEVVGFTMTTNIASQRVLEKPGLTFNRVLEHARLPHWFGRLTLAPISCAS